MIVDLLRNDLSRIAEPFSVRVPRLFHTEPCPRCGR
jgi:anthranilate/para-aminobenzoate synthase component I